MLENIIEVENKGKAMIETRDLLLHPTRLRIVQTLVGGAMTPQQLKQHLGDVAQATLYRYLNQLVDGGMLEVVQERSVRGSVERTYGVVATAVSLSAEELETATTEDHFRYFATFLGTLLADFATYLDGGDVELVADRVGYRQVPLWLTDQELDVMVTRMRGAMQEHLENQPGPGRRRRLISTIVMPDDRK